MFEVLFGWPVDAIVCRKCFETAQDVCANSGGLTRAGIERDVALGAGNRVAANLHTLLT